MDRNQQIRPNQDPQPPITVERDGSVAEIHNLDAILNDARRGEVMIFDRGDFSSPIARLQAVVSRQENDYKEWGYSFMATFTPDQFAQLPTGSLLDQERDLSSVLGTELAGHQSLLDRQRGEPRPGKKIDNGQFETVGTRFNNVVLVQYQTGNQFLVWINDDGRVLVGNNLYSHSKDENGQSLLYLQPRSEHTVDSTQVAKDFWNTVMWVGDSINKVYKKRPMERSYLVGQNPQYVYRVAPEQAPGETKEPQKQSKTMPTGESPDFSESKMTLEDIGGLEDVKQVLKEVAISFSHPEVMAKWGATRPQGVLLYGEPGTGKTMLVEALANEMSAKLWQIKSTDIYDKWLGNSEQKIQEIFSKVRSMRERTILLFDEFDAIIGISEEPTSGGDNARNSVAGIFKQEMNTLVQENPNILVVATTNHPDRIDDALIRAGRFDYKVYVPMPNEAARRDIMLNIIAHSIMAHEQEGFKVFGQDIDLDQLTRETDGFSGADLAEIFRRLQFGKAMQEAQHGEASPITNDELLGEIRKFRTNG